jgi:two-component system, NtrC family, nitrogen regulation sensor histidine kinase NtrY
MTSIEHVSMAEQGVSTAAAPRLGTRVLGPIAIGLALLSALATFLVLTGLTPIVPTHQVVVTLLVTNGITVLLLLAIIGWELWQIVEARRRGRAAARLHVRIIGLFSVIAAVPAILVAIVASITLDRGLDRWFSTRTRAAIENSLNVAQAYVREHADAIRGDIVAMAFDVSRAKPLFDQDRARFRQFFHAQASLRGLPAAMMFGDDLWPIEKVELAPGHDFQLPPADRLAEIGTAEPRIAMAPNAEYVAALIKLNGYDNTYLYVARPLLPRVVEQLKITQASVAEYASMEERRFGVQVAFGLMYTVVALIVLLSAVWIGLTFANRFRSATRKGIWRSSANPSTR